MDAVTIDAAIAEDGNESEKDLSVGWVDYRKAYNMVPHRWVNTVLKAIRAPRQVRNTVEKLIPQWKMDLKLGDGEGTTTIPVDLKRGLFQGDSLSPLLLCLCVAPLSKMLRWRAGYKYSNLQDPITHLLFMDDTKVYESSGEELERTLAKVKEVSKAIGMSLGVRWRT